MGSISVIFAILFSSSLILSCTKSSKLVVTKGPDISNKNRTGTVVDNHQKQNTSIDLSMKDVKASIPLQNSTFYFPYPAKNCGNKVFTQRLEGTRVALNTENDLEFSHRPNANPSDNLASARAEGVIFKVSILDETRTKVEKSFIVDFTDKANFDTTTSYLRVKDFFCDKNGELYLQAVAMKVYEAQPGIGHYLSREHVFQITRFIHVNTKTNVGALTKKFLLSNFNPQTILLSGDDIYGMSLRNGSMSIFDFSLPDFTPKTMKYFRLHTGNSDHILNLLQGSEGNFYASGVWSHEGKNTLELIKLDQDLKALPDIVTDNQGSGNDSLADLLLRNINTFTIHDMIELGDDILIATSLATPHSPQSIKKAIIAVDKNNGDIDRNFHNTGIETFPTSSLKMDHLKKDELILISYTSGNSIGVRLMDRDGKLVKINGDIESVETKTNPILIDTIVLDVNNALVFYVDNNNNEHLNYLKVSLTE